MRVQLDKRLEKVVSKFNPSEKARVNRVVQLFQKEGFLLDGRYLKKLTQDVWEFRAGKIRLLFGIVDSLALVVNVFRKKTNKTPIKEIDLAERRLKEYR